MTDPALPPFPVTDDVLDQVEHALQAAYEVDDEGTHTVVGAEFTLSKLMDFYSGVDEADGEVIGDVHGIPIIEYSKPRYTEHDVIASLINEVRRLRTGAHTWLHPHLRASRATAHTTVLGDRPDTPQTPTQLAASCGYASTVPSLTSKQAIAALVAGAFVHELSAKQGQLISHAWDAWMKHPVLTTVVTFGLFNLTAAHLCNVFERFGLTRLDPFAGFGYPALSWLKGRPA